MTHAAASPLSRFERPNGRLTVHEAAALLGLPTLQVYRLAKARRFPLLPKRVGPRRVPVAVCRLLKGLAPQRRRSVAGTAGLMAGKSGHGG